MDVKDTVHKAPLLLHLVELVVEMFPESSDLYSELPHVHRVAKVRRRGRKRRREEKIEEGEGRERTGMMEEREIEGREVGVEQRDSEKAGKTGRRGRAEEGEIGEMHVTLNVSKLWVVGVSR